MNQTKLSMQLDVAIEREEYHRLGMWLCRHNKITKAFHRDCFLHWKQKRQQFERQIDNPVNELLTLAEQAWGKGTNDGTD